MYAADDLGWTMKLQYVLCTTWREVHVHVPTDDGVAALPSPELLESYMLVASTPDQLCLVCTRLASVWRLSRLRMAETAQP